MVLRWGKDHRWAEKMRVFKNNPEVDRFNAKLISLITRCNLSQWAYNINFMDSCAKTTPAAPTPPWSRFTTSNL